MPKNPQWVAPIFAPSAHMVAMLGDSEKIVAVTQGNMRDLLFLDIYPAVAEARVPSGGGSINVEELFTDPLPDIIFCDTPLVQDTKMFQQLEKFGIPLVAIDFRTMAEHKYAIRLIGAIMGRQDKAEDFCNNYDQTFALVKERTANIPVEDQALVYHAINELLRTEATNSLPGEWIPQIGIKLVGAAEVDEEGDEKNRLSLEELMAYDPPYIIINGEDVYDYIEQSERLHVLSAYQNGQIYLLPYGITRFAHTNSIETPLAMLWLGKTIYPELFEDIDMQKELKSFYGRFFDAELTDEMVEQILSGRGLRIVKDRENPL